MNYELTNQNVTGPADDAGKRLRSYVTWGPRDILLGVFGIAFLVLIISIVVVGPIAAKYGEDTPETYFASAIATLIWDLGFALVAYTLVRRHGGGWPNLGFRKAYFVTRGIFHTIVSAIPLPKLAAAVLAGYALTYFLVMLYGILVEVTGATFLEPSEQLPTTLFDNSYVVIATGIAVVIGAPFAEEILFRGFLYGGLRRYMPMLPALLLSGFIFSMAHFNVGLLIPFTLVGAVLAYIYERTGTLYAAIAVHLLFNLTSFSFLVFFPELR